MAAGRPDTGSVTGASGELHIAAAGRREGPRPCNLGGAEAKEKAADLGVIFEHSEDLGIRTDQEA